MKILKKMFYIFFCVFLLTGCNNKIESYEYVGKSDNWEAIFNYKVEYLSNGDNFSRYEVKVNYIGDEKLQNGTLIEYTYKLGSKSGLHTYDFEEIKETTEVEMGVTGSGGSNLSILQGSEIGIVKVSWNGKYEEIEIKNAKNEE